MMNAISIKTMLAATTLAITGVGLQAGAAAADIGHSAGFICGNGPTNNRIIAGDYRAHFNIRNGDDRTQTVELKLALTFPNAAPDASFTPGQVSSLQAVTLQPGEAVMIDCDELVPENAGPPYIGGVLTATSRRALDVTLIQTAGPATGPVNSVSVTRVPALREGRRDDD